MTPTKLPDAKGNQSQHYANLNSWMPDGKYTSTEAARAMLGKFWRIDETTYWYFCEMLPPAYCPGGFRMIEMLTDEIAATYLHVGADY